jgi:tRNA1(Val) A37 N6-methylase TrmN6
MNDYRQPDFFRFGSDSLWLAEVVRNDLSVDRELRVLELGIGCGVISCELSQHLKLSEIFGVEAQFDFSEVLLSNLANFSRSKSFQIFWGKVSEFNLSGEQRFDLVYFNPPYFDPKAGRSAPDHRRNIAHRWVLDPFIAWIECAKRSLTDKGMAYWLMKDPHTMGKSQAGEGFELEHIAHSGALRVLRLRRLNVE